MVTLSPNARVMALAYVGYAAAVAAAIAAAAAAASAASSLPGHRHLRWVRRINFKQLSAELDLAVRLAVKCGEAMLAVSSTGSSTATDATLKDGKKGIDPQTSTDLSNEALVVDALKAAFPKHAIIGEESAAASGKIPKIDPRTPTWVIDPIDGTQNFCHSLPLAAVSIGLCIDGRPALGVIYDPYRDELFVGITGEGAYCNGRRLQADASRTTLDKAMVITDVGYERSAKGARRLSACHEALLQANTFGIRCIGSTVLSLAWLAAGRASAVYMGVFKKDTPKAWDWCAAHAIGTASGVTFFRLDSDVPFDLTSPSVCASGSEPLARTLRRTLCAALVTLDE